MGSEALTEYAVGWRRRLAAEQRQRDQAAARSREAAIRVAELLCTVYGATRVWLFGSLAGGGWTEGRSDIDLAVAGLVEADYLEALAEAQQIACGPVDLVLVEHAAPGLRRSIEEEGEVLR